MDLFDLYKNHKDRECGKWEHYFEIYDNHFKKYVGKEVTIFEIGVCHGGSLQIWKKYFGHKCKVVGIDIDKNTVFSEDQIFVEVGNQGDPKFLSEVVKKHGAPDIVIDDGSHIQFDILNTFSLLYQVLNDGGTYVIEDTHTSYRKEYMGGLASPLNILTVLSKQVHDVNVEWIEEPYLKVIDDLKCISFYNSLIFLQKEKAQKSKPFFAGKSEKVSQVNSGDPIERYDWGTKKENTSKDIPKTDSTSDWKSNSDWNSSLSSSFEWK